MCFNLNSAKKEKYSCMGTLVIDGKSETLYRREAVNPAATVAPSNIKCYKRVVVMKRLKSETAKSPKRYQGENRYQGGLTYTQGVTAVQEMRVDGYVGGGSCSVNIGLHSFVSGGGQHKSLKDMKADNANFKSKKADCRWVECIIPAGAKYYTDGKFNVSNRIKIVKEV